MFLENLCAFLWLPFVSLCGYFLRRAITPESIVSPVREIA